MFSYEKFKSRIKEKGVARNNRFNVNIALPESLGVSYDAFSIMLVCTSVSLTGVNVASEPVKLYGESVEVPYDRNFSGVSFTFVVTSDMKERKLFDDWIDFIQNPTTRTFRYIDEFKAREVKIEVLDLKDNPKYEITLYDAFPKTIGALSLSSEDNGAMTFNVDMDYRYYTTSSNT